MTDKGTKARSDEGTKGRARPSPAGISSDFRGRDLTPRFIVGMSRAGTQWLCRSLNEHPQAAAFGESMFWGRHYLPPADRGAYTPEQLSAVKESLLSHGTCIVAVSGSGPGSLKRVRDDNIEAVIDEAFAALPQRPTPADVFRSLSRMIAWKEGKSIAVEKTPHHLNWIDRILAAMPDSRFVIMVREPWGFMVSYKHQGDRQPPPIRRHFARRYHPFAAALVWKGYQRAALDAAARYPERTMVVRFDDLRRDARATLDRVQEFLGLDPVDLSCAVPPDNTSFPDGRWPELRGEDRFWMNLVAGRMIRRAGYKRSSGPVEPLRVIWSIIRLPFWALDNLFTLRGRIGGSTFAYLWRWVGLGHR